MRLRLGLGELLLVTIVSVLIFYLAFTQTKKDFEINFEVQFRLPDGVAGERTIIRPTSPTAIKVVAEGSAVARKDAESLDRSLITLTVGETGIPGEIGDNVVDIEQAVQGLLARRRIDAAIKTATPIQVPLRLDAITSRTVSVTPVLPGVRVDGNIIVQPPTVTITGPAGVLEQAGEIRVEATMEGSVLGNLETGRRHSPMVRVRLVPEFPGADLSRLNVVPDLVSVVFTLLARDQTLRIGTQDSPIPAVPVHVAISPVDLERFVVTVPDRDLLLRDIELFGPADQIAQITARTFRVFAYVQVTTDDLELALVGDVETATIGRPVTLWSLPPGVRVVDPGSTDAQIEARRSGDPPPSGIRLTIERRGEE